MLFPQGLYYTGNVSAESAAEWVFENIDHPELNDPFQVCCIIPLFTILTCCSQNTKSVLLPLLYYVVIYCTVLCSVFQ